MADTLTFEYDKHADELKINGVLQENFRHLGGRLPVDSPFGVECRGGAVFAVSVPHAEPVATTVAATGDTPESADDAQTIKDEAEATQRAEATEKGG